MTASSEYKTHATITFALPNYNPSVQDFYVSVFISDIGFPEAVAVALKKTIELDSSNDCLASQFLRANPIAKLSREPDFYTSTDFRYIVEKSQIRAEKLVLNPERRSRFQLKYRPDVRPAKERKKWGAPACRRPEAARNCPCCPAASPVCAS